MRSLASSILDTAVRIGGFLDRNDQLVPTINASDARRDLEAVTASLAAHAEDQATGAMQSKGETNRQRDLMSKLRVCHMRPIASIAKARLSTVPNLTALKMPHRRMRGGRLVAYANAMATTTAEYADIFVAHARPVDFVAQLQAAAAELEQSVGVRAASRAQRKRGTAGIDSDMSSARKTIAVLDTAIVPLLTDNEPLLAEWRALKHIARKPGPRAAPATDASSIESNGSPR